MNKGLILLVTAMCFIILSCVIGATSDTTTEIVDCYDENNNKINELTCTDEVYSAGTNIALTVCILAALGCMLIGFVVVMEGTK